MKQPVGGGALLRLLLGRGLGSGALLRFRSERGAAAVTVAAE